MTTTRGPREGRSCSMQHLASLSPPPGGPPRLYHLARRARVAQALGPDVGRHLVDLRREGDELVLVFAGEGWRRALEHARVALEEAVSRVVARPGLRIRIECIEPSSAGEVEGLETAPAESADAYERLRDLARKLWHSREK